MNKLYHYIPKLSDVFKSHIFVLRFFYSNQKANFCLIGTKKLYRMKSSTTLLLKTMYKLYNVHKANILQKQLFSTLFNGFQHLSHVCFCHFCKQFHVKCCFLYYMHYVVNILWIYPYTILTKQDKNTKRANT